MSDHIVHARDCIDGMREMPDSCVDHVITDPPYEQEAHTKGRRIRTHGAAGCIEQPLKFEPMTPALRFKSSLEFARLARRWVLVFCQVEAAMLWRFELERAGLRYMRTCVWTKPDGQPQYTGDRPGCGFECIVVMHAKFKSRWNGGGRIGVFGHTRHQDHDTPRELRHQTVKPIPLMRELVELFTDREELVLDPFAGAGTTGVACKQLGRRFVGFENNAQYAEHARKRIDAAVEQPQMFDRRSAKSGKRKQEALL